MRKYIIASSMILFLLLLSGIAYGQDSDSSDVTITDDVDATETVESSGVEVKYLFKQELKMVFEGDSMNWTGSYVVEEITDEEGNKSSVIKVTVSPKKYKDLRWVNYEITTSNGVLEGSKWLIFGKPLYIESDSPIPENDEKIEVRIKQGDLTEIFYLECVLFEELTPVDGSEDDTVTAEQAVELMKVAYFNTYGIEMPDSYTIYVEYIDGEWVVSYDDNDGVGGRAYLTINAKTSESGDIEFDDDIKIVE